MRAVVVSAPGGPSVLEHRDVPVPLVQPGSVRVAVRSIGVNFRDVQQRRGAAPDLTYPFVPGSDFAGEVLEAGEGVRTLKAGDRVFGVSLSGAYAEQVVAPAVVVYPVPQGLDFDLAAALPVAGLSASFLLTTAGLRAGMTAVTYAAAGGLGCFLGGVLSEAGVRSIGLVSSAEKAAVARAAGHSDVVIYREADPVEAVRALTDGAGVDVVLDSVAGPGFARSFAMLRSEGVVVLCGRSAGAPDLATVYPEFIESRRNLALRDFYLATYTTGHFAEVPGRLETLAGGIRSGRIRIPVRSVPFLEVRRAHELLESGATTGKVVLHV
jgi:NADPH:quinone reductase